MITTDLANIQVWVATTPVDMRKSFDGLAAVAREFLKHDPLSGSLFVFRNKGGASGEDPVVGPRWPGDRPAARGLSGARHENNFAFWRNLFDAGVYKYYK